LAPWHRVRARARVGAGVRARVRVRAGVLCYVCCARLECKLHRGKPLPQGRLVRVRVRLGLV
jgi:hypothetical protein